MFLFGGFNIASQRAQFFHFRAVVITSEFQQSGDDYAQLTPIAGDVSHYVLLDVRFPGKVDLQIR
ncbi:hypothetical protein [Thalassolituus sp.]|uniref:hypothetical protein n=1 Tax=Thalassolituus sp. TaxID=2030822 RepID=UPI003513A205